MNCLLFFFVGLVFAEEQPKTVPNKTPLSTKEQAVVNKILQRKTNANSPSNQEKAQTPKQDTPLNSTNNQQTQQSRLLGTEQAQTTNLKPEKQGAPTLGPFWGLLVLAAVCGLIALMMRKRNGVLGNIQVLSRSFLGREGSLAVIEVEDGNKNKRRLLIGLSVSGSPSMIADLSNSSVLSAVPLTAKTPAAARQRVNIVVGDPIKHGQELLSEVLSERGQNATPNAQIQPMATPSESSGTEDPWLQGIEQALGKNG